MWNLLVGLAKELYIITLRWVLPDQQLQIFPSSSDSVACECELARTSPLEHASVHKSISPLGKKSVLGSTLPYTHAFYRFTTNVSKLLYYCFIGTNIQSLTKRTIQYI